MAMNYLGEKRVDEALEKNLETISTQLRRSTTNASKPPSQLTQHDLQLFDSHTSNGHLAREMTPDSIGEESIQYRQNFHPSNIPPMTMDPYGQPLWSSPVYPYPTHQHPGLYLPYPTAAAVANNGLPPFYSAQMNQQVLSAYYTQQHAATARFLQEHGSWPGTRTSSRETPLVIELFLDMNTSTKEPNAINDDSNRMKKNQSVINGSLTRLSPDLLSDGDGGGTNDADSIISVDSIKSNSAISKSPKEEKNTFSSKTSISDMPVVEDGLSDSENITTDEHSPPSKLPVLTKSTPIDLNHSSSSTLPYHKHHHTKPNNSPIEPPTSSSQPTNTTGKSIFISHTRKSSPTKGETLDTNLPPRKKGLFRMFIL